MIENQPAIKFVVALTGPRGSVAVRALCRLGGLRVGAERLDLGVELMRRNMSESARRHLKMLLAQAIAPIAERELEPTG